MRTPYRSRRSDRRSRGRLLGRPGEEPPTPWDALTAKMRERGAVRGGNELLLPIAADGVIFTMTKPGVGHLARLGGGGEGMCIASMPTTRNRPH